MAKVEEALEALRVNVAQGLLDLLRAGLAAGEVAAEEIERAVQAEIEGPGADSGRLVLTAPSQALLRRVAESRDKDLLQVAAKILKSARLAALTHRGIDDAYVDQPLFPEGRD